MGGVGAMIEVVDNQPLTDMLEKLFSFFDIVIRAARKSAGLYRCYSAASHRTMLRAVELVYERLPLRRAMRPNFPLCGF